jgi:3-dehydroquinate synthase
MNNLVLTGFMGTGKTTTGRILAKRLGVAFVDTDDEIERRAGMSVSRIFDTAGETAFRELEREVLRETLSGRGQVIATGGGTLVPESNRALARTAAIMCLTADPEAIRTRLKGAADRPLLRTPEALYRLLAEREAVYSQFAQVDTTDLEPEETADEVARRAGLPLSTLRFEHSDQSTIMCEEAAIDRLGELLVENGISGRVLLVTDENLETLGWKARMADALRGSGFDVTTTVLPAGEEQKTLETLEDLLGDCITAGLDRGSTVIGLGGGVVGDLSGMLAATYMRGTRLVLVPTTLLAQVDASIGGKTGVDAHGVKNLAGAFHPASLVVIDPDVLSTLPRPLLSDGMAEIVKIALMRSPRLTERLCALDDVEDVLGHPDITWAAARLKTDIVAIDPFERGERALLNYGHTAGHGIEAASRYGTPHGRCVAAGMVGETAVAVESGEASSEVERTLRELLDRFDLPRSVPGVQTAGAMAAARTDKKRLDGAVRVAFPKAIGRGVVTTWNEAQLQRAIETAAGGSAK